MAHLRKIDQQRPVAAGELAFREHCGDLRKGQAHFEDLPVEVEAHAPLPRFGVKHGGGRDAALAACRGQNERGAPRPGGAAVQKRFPQLFAIHRLGEIARRRHLVAPQRHFPVGGDKDDGGVLMPRAQRRGQRHAVHHHVQQKDVERPARADGRQQRSGAVITGDLRRDALFAQYRSGHLLDPGAIRRLVGADGEFQQVRARLCRHAEPPRNVSSLDLQTTHSSSSVANWLL